MALALVATTVAAASPAPTTVNAAAAAAAVDVVDVRRAGPVRGDNAPDSFRLSTRGLLSQTGDGYRTFLNETGLTFRAGAPRVGTTQRRAASRFGWSGVETLSAARLATYVKSEGVRLLNGTRVTGRVRETSSMPAHARAALSGPYLYLATGAGTDTAVLDPTGRKVGRAAFASNADKRAFFGPWWVQVRGRTVVIRNSRTGAEHNVAPPIESLSIISGIEYDIDQLRISGAELLGPNLLIHVDGGDLNDGTGACPIDSGPNYCGDRKHVWELRAVINWRSGDVLNVFGTPGTTGHSDAMLVEGGTVLATHTWTPRLTQLSYLPHGTDVVTPFHRLEGHSFLAGMQQRTLMLAPESARAKSRLVTVAPGGIAPQDARLLGAWGTTWNQAKGAWSPQFDLTQAVGRWKMQITDVDGDVVRTLSGRTVSSGSVRPHWNGEDSSGQRVAQGTYRWVLTGTTVGGGSIVGTLDGAVSGSVTLR